MTSEECDAEIAKILAKLEQLDIAAFGIMDYWTFEGYSRIKSYLKTHPGSCTKAIFPGIELRVQASTNYRLNIHALLSDNVTPQELVDFRSLLEIQIGPTTRALSDEALIQLAKTFDHAKAKVHGFKPEDLTNDANLLRLGSMTAEITRESFNKAKDKLGRDKCFIILGYDTSDGIEKLDWKAFPSDDNFFMQSADLIETRDQENINLFLGIRTNENTSFIENFWTTVGKRRIAVVSGSDAHAIDDYGRYPSDKITWIKADPTFLGLNQVVINPMERSFVGMVPPKLEEVNRNKTRYIKEITIAKNADSDSEEEWFDTHVELNYDLVAVIGNRGTGKSAFTDAVGLCGNSSAFDKFSFLTPQRFKDRRDNKAKNYSAQITWADDTVSTVNLNDEPKATSFERVKYLPQNYIEDICNEIGEKGSKGFQDELESIIFSHIDSTDRLGKISFGSLLEFKTAQVQVVIGQYRNKIEFLNKKICNVEDRLRPDYAEKLRNELEAREEELLSLEGSKPPEVSKPNDETATPEQKAAAEKVANLRVEIENLEAKHRTNIDILAQNKKEDALVDRYLELVASLEKALVSFHEDAQQFSELNIDSLSIVKAEIDTSSLSQRKSELISAISALNNKSSEAVENSIPRQIQVKREEIARLEKGLESRQVLYEDYLKRLDAWEKSRIVLLGTETDSNSIAGIKSILNGIPALRSALQSHVEERSSLTQSVFEELSKIASIYRELHSPVDRFVQEHRLLAGESNLEFKVLLRQTGFADRFGSMINHGVIGTFAGISESELLIKTMSDSTDFTNVESVLQFITNVVNSLKFLGGKVSEEDLDVRNQIRKGFSKEALYDFLFKLDYIMPSYTLMLDNLEITKLSPGQRGQLLLMFYLLIDKDTLPLIVDQPEGNLDNNTIVRSLVNAINYAKERRQIIIVTHNPNLAVVCDAEQVIHSYFDIQNKKFRYDSGSIENPSINLHLLNVLEGSRPAFDRRDDTYFAMPNLVFSELAYGPTVAMVESRNRIQRTVPAVSKANN